MGKVERCFSVLFGLFLLAVGLYVLGFGHTGLLWRVGGGLALLVLGGNMLYAAYRRQPSWMSRLGPLP